MSLSKNIYFCENILLEITKKGNPVMVLWQCKELCVNLKISQHYTCRRHFRHGKGFLNGFENYVAFPLLEIPMGQCYSIPSTFHHSSLSLCVLHFMFFFPFYFIFHLNVFQVQQYIKKNFPQIIASQMFLVNAVILLICQSSGPAISTTQRFYSA